MGTHALRHIVHHTMADFCSSLRDEKHEVTYSGPDGLQGELFVYSESPSRLVAFVSSSLGNADPANLVFLFIPGLTDGMLGLGYCAPMARMLMARFGVPFVSPTLSSSYLGFGTSSLDQDAQEIAKLLRHEKFANSQVVLCGHSTGCQDIVTILSQHHDVAERVIGFILQGPVSDREAMGLEDGSENVRQANEKASQMVAGGRGWELMARDVAGCFMTPICAERYASLSGRLTADDMFSSDLGADELAKIFQKVPSHCKCCIVFSGSDEYCPPSVLRQVHEDGGIARRIAEAMPCESSYSIIVGASHSLGSSRRHSHSFLRIVSNFVGSLIAEQSVNASSAPRPGRRTRRAVKNSASSIESRKGSTVRFPLAVASSLSLLLYMYLAPRRR